YLCEVHHIHEWAHGGTTDIDRLTFACPAHHRLLSQGWTTRKQPDGTTEWIPPPQLNLGSSELAGQTRHDHIIHQRSDGIGRSRPHRQQPAEHEVPR
ncbi:HNH endonuclease, partial [Mycobacterium sp. CBMA271]|uniref:HNH endonuclease signature motif containing protein n=1 Tax=Mycobacteroides sp. CBMA 271 TaxID=2606608 RepID=UPI0013285478